MIKKKTIFGLLIFSFLNGCTSPTVMLGPVYTFTSTGNIYQSAFTYGSGKMIKKQTGKTPLENLKEIRLKDEKKEKNIQKNTLESEDFYIFVKNRIETTGKSLKFTNQ